jgi:hypothetical protein
VPASKNQKIKVAHGGLRGASVNLFFTAGQLGPDPNTENIRPRKKNQREVNPPRTRSQLLRTIRESSIGDQLEQKKQHTNNKCEQLKKLSENSDHLYGRGAL